MLIRRCSLFFDTSSGSCRGAGCHMDVSDCSRSPRARRVVSSSRLVRLLRASTCTGVLDDTPWRGAVCAGWFVCIEFTGVKHVLSANMNSRASSSSSPVRELFSGFGSDSRGQSYLVGTMLIIGITVVVTVASFAVGLGFVNTSQTNSETQKAAQAFQTLASDSSMVAYG